MLIRFSLENWMSFRDRTTFSMVASRELQHKERVPEIKKRYNVKVLPSAAIYGGNASGKTNFFKALHFVKTFIERGTLPDRMINVEPFRLDTASIEKPCLFVIELLVHDRIYAYSFSLTRKAVIEEKLVEVLSTREKVIYHRQNGNVRFFEKYGKNKSLKNAAKATRDNLLVLTNTVFQNEKTFKPIYEWFRDTLVLIAPDSRFEPFEQFLIEEHPLFEAYGTLLSQLDTGILRLSGETIPFENIPLPEPLRMKIREDMKDGMIVRLRAEPLSQRYIVTSKDGELTAKKLVAYHQSIDGSEVRFDMLSESDGSLRVIDLAPAFLDLSSISGRKVYIIDELDRSLHTHLSRNLLLGYLNSCSKESRSQLLFTTHDVLLMDQDLMRRDEMWVAERDQKGVSSLISFSEYKDVRYDKDIRRSYLQGRLGGIPHILQQSGFSCLDGAETGNPE